MARKARHLSPGPGPVEFHQGGFAALDTNGDGRLDDQDRFVTVKPVTFDGVAADSITLDVGEANLAAGRLDPAEVEAGPHTLTIWGRAFWRRTISSRPSRTSACSQAATAAPRTTG